MSLYTEAALQGRVAATRGHVAGLQIDCDYIMSGQLRQAAKGIATYAHSKTGRRIAGQVCPQAHYSKRAALIWSKGLAQGQIFVGVGTAMLDRSHL